MEKFSSFWNKIRESSQIGKVRIGFSDSADVRIIEAVSLLSSYPHIEPILIGPDFKKSLNLSDQKLIQSLFDHRRKLAITREEVSAKISDPLIQGVAHLIRGEIDGLISGATCPTADVVKAAIHFIGPRKNQKLISGQFLIESESLATEDDTPFLFSDCAVIPEPSARSLAANAISAAESFNFFTKKTPKVALLSFGTRGSAEHPLVDKLREALDIVRKSAPNLIIDGEIQADAALDLNVAKIKKAGDSPLDGKANVFIFPSLESGNIGYKLIQRFGNVRIAGPLLWGLDKPLSDLSRGCSVVEILDTVFCLYQLITGNKK